MPQLSHAQKLIDLRGFALAKKHELSVTSPLPLTQTQCQQEGRARILDEVIATLSEVTRGLPPMQAQEVVQPLLQKLAERKAAGLAFFRRNPMRYGIDHLDEWRMEGELQQIEEVQFRLCTCFSPRWRAQPWKHGCYFQVFHSQAEGVIDDAEMIARWQSEQRAHWFWEVAIIEVAPARTIDQRLEEVFRQTNHIEGNWTQEQAVFWVQSGMPLRSTSRHDVIVSVLSGSAWMVAPIGFRLLQGYPVVSDEA